MRVEGKLYRCRLITPRHDVLRHKVWSLSFMGGATTKKSFYILTLSPSRLLPKWRLKSFFPLMRQKFSRNVVWGRKTIYEGKLISMKEVFYVDLHKCWSTLGVNFINLPLRCDNMITAVKDAENSVRRKVCRNRNQINYKKVGELKSV